MSDNAAPTRPVPKPTPETAHFWEGTALGELRLQRCRACQRAYFPPQPFCPSCGSPEVTVERATGRATLHSYVISSLAVPGVTPPNVLAVVALEEGPRLLTNLTGVAPTPDALVLDMALEVGFEPAGRQMLPVFHPAPADGPR